MVDEHTRKLIHDAIGSIDEPVVWDIATVHYVEVRSALLAILERTS